MKSLLLLRHAKSDWSDAGRTDHDRPLNKRGKRDAPRMGALLRSEKLVPELIVSSSARRARKTAAKAAKACGYDRDIQLEDALYMATPAAHVDVLRQLDRRIDRVMLVGHNPGLEELLWCLTGAEAALPTAALAVIELPVKRWEDVKPEPFGRLIKLYLPREID